MTDDLRFIEKYRNRPVLFDANLLLVYVVGKCDEANLPRLHHTKQYVHDFPLLNRLFNHFSLIHTTPNVLTEVSNLGKSLGSVFFDELKRATDLLEERFCTSIQAAANPVFRRLGLTDSALVELAPKTLIITADHNLYQTLRNRGMDAVNFNHLRTSTW